VKEGHPINISTIIMYCARQGFLKPLLLSFSAGVADVITGGDLYDGDLYAVSFYDGES
jgi:hypothetical protein